MIEISVTELKKNLSEVWHSVAYSKEQYLVIHGRANRPLFKITPIKDGERILQSTDGTVFRNNLTRFSDYFGEKNPKPRVC